MYKMPKKLNNYATYISGAGKDRRWKDIIGQGKILIGPVFNFLHILLILGRIKKIGPLYLIQKFDMFR